MLFSNFDFNILDDPDFKEDSVREEIIAPLLKELGYSASGKNKIIRSKALKHPYVYIGTKKHTIHIIPDYLMRVGEDDSWVLDAKAPHENILDGKNVEQAFSYAIHPDVRSNLYALCNGRAISVFQTNKLNPIFYAELKRSQRLLDAVKRVLSPKSIKRPHLANFLPDFGLYMIKSGWKATIEFIWYHLELIEIVRMDKESYTTFSKVKFFGMHYGVTLDFKQEQFNQLISCFSEDAKNEINELLWRRPFQVDFYSPLIVGAKAIISKKRFENEDEDYIPLEIVEFIRPSRAN